MVYIENVVVYAASYAGDHIRSIAFILTGGQFSHHKYGEGSSNMGGLAHSFRVNRSPYFQNLDLELFYQVRGLSSL